MMSKTSNIDLDSSHVTLSGGSESDNAERDEIKEIQNLSKQDNRRIRVWRLVMLTVILCTAVSISILFLCFSIKVQNPILSSLMSLFLLL